MSPENHDQSTENDFDGGIPFVPKSLAPVFLLGAVVWSFVGVFDGSWEESNGLYPLQQWLHDGEPFTLGAGLGLGFLLLMFVLGIASAIKVYGE